MHHRIDHGSPSTGEWIPVEIKAAIIISLAEIMAATLVILLGR